MTGLEKIIKEWPVLIQGALGSAIFWLILLAGQKLTIFLISKYHGYSYATRRSKLLNDIIRLNATKAKDIVMYGHYSSLLIYRTSARVIKAIIWLILGYIFSYIDSTFALVGCFGALFNLFIALDVVKPVMPIANVDHQIESLEKELAELDMKHLDHA